MNKNVVEKFYEIRNLPYHISINGEKGTDCEDKANMLVSEFKKLGITSRLRIGFFKWANIGLPAEVLEIPHENDCSHTFVESLVNDRWIQVDPTWNPELQKAGFPIAEWDGESGTKLAIDCDKLLPAQETEQYIESIDREKDMQENGEFYQAINKYCDSFL